MMKRFSKTLLLLSGAAAASAGRLPFAKTSPVALKSTKTLLEIRGGAIDQKKLFTTAVTASGLAQGFMSFEAPEATIDMYGGT